MTSRSTGWCGTPSAAPVADSSLITRARNEGLEPGQKLGDLFGPRASDKAKGFLGDLSPRARAALENAARAEDEKGRP